MTNVSTSINYIVVQQSEPNQTNPGFLVFNDVQSSIDYATQSGFNDVIIHVDIGSFPAPITIPQNMHIVINGAINGNTMIGPITWTCSGSFGTPDYSVLILRDVSVVSIDIVDGTSPAGLAIFVLENCIVGNFGVANSGYIKSHGTSFLETVITGILPANTVIPGLLANSLVDGYCILPGSKLSITNSVMSGDITSSDIWMTGSHFDGYQLHGSGTIEMHRCAFLNTPTFTFTGPNPGIVDVDGITDFQLLQRPYTIVNGSKFRQDGGTTFGMDKQTVAVDGADIALNVWQYSTKYIIFTGTLAANVQRKITFPIGAWVISCQDFVFGGNSKLVIANGTHTANIGTAGLFTVSITANSIIIK